jgi:hypothetical protein
MEKGWLMAIWDVASKTKLGLLPQLRFLPVTKAFSPDGRFLALGGSRVWKEAWFQMIGPGTSHFEDRVLVLYDVATLKRVRTLAFPVWPPDSQAIPEVDFP